MLETLPNLPAGVVGVRASGTVTKDDYDRVVWPLLKSAHAEGRRVRLLYVFAPDFKALTMGAGWEDMRLGMKYLRMFERCAIVSDVTWIREASQLFGAMMTCPVRVYRNVEEQEAVRWLAAPSEDTVKHRLLADAGVVIVEPTRPLRAEDFDALSMTVDPWIEAKGTLRGIVIHTRGFPGWENLGSFLAAHAVRWRPSPQGRTGGARSRWCTCRDGSLAERSLRAGRSQALRLRPAGRCGCVG